MGYANQLGARGGPAAAASAPTPQTSPAAPASIQLDSPDWNAARVHYRELQLDSPTWAGAQALYKQRIDAERVESRRRRTAFRAGVVGDDPDEPFSDNEESDSEHDGSPARFVHKLAKIPIPRRTARPTTEAQSSPATGAGGHQAVSKRKTNSPQLAQQAMKMGLSPSQAVAAAMSGGGLRRVSVVGAKHQSAALDGLQSPPRSGRQQARPQKRNSLTWRRGPFAAATPDSVHMDPAARRLKKALSAAFDAAAAAGTATSAGQRKKYMGEINVRNVLVTLGPSNALELLDALEDAQLEEKRLTAAWAATIISAAKVTTSDSYVSKKSIPGVVPALSQFL